MDDSRRLLEKLNEKNVKLKKLLMDTEKEMENIRIQAHDDMIKTKKIINAISPNLLKYITNNNTHKFSQNEGTKDYNQAILVIRQLEITLDQAQTQIDEIEKNNF